MTHHLTQEFYCPVIALVVRILASETRSSVDQFTCCRKLDDIAKFGRICDIVTGHRSKQRKQEISMLIFLDREDTVDLPKRDVFT